MPEVRAQGVLSRQLILSLYLPAALLALGESLVTPVIPLFTKQFGVGFAIWRPVAQLGATVTPAIFAGIAEHAGYGYGFLYLAGCALIVALGVGTVLGDTLARHDRADAAWEAGGGG